MTKGKLITIVIAVLLVFGIGGWYVRGAGAKASDPYRLAEVRLGTVESTVTSTGRLTAIQSVAVGTQVSGRVTELHADYNDRVRQGQLLARIDPTLQRQAVRNSEASLVRVRAALEQAERDYQRNRTLYDQQVITEAEFSQIEYSLTVARSNVTSAEVSLEQARQNLAYTEIYAPIDGVVVERNVEPGQTVAASLSAPQLYLIASDLSRMEILANVDESDIGEIRNGMPVRFTVQAYPNDTFEGIVRQVRLSSSTQENVVNYTAVISVENGDWRLLPGMTASVDFVSERAENVFMVPNAALRFRPTEEMIAQLDDSTMIALVRGSGRLPGANGGFAGGGAAGAGGAAAAAVGATTPSAGRGARIAAAGGAAPVGEQTAANGAAGTAQRPLAAGDASGAAGMLGPGARQGASPEGFTGTRRERGGFGGVAPGAEGRDAGRGAAAPDRAGESAGTPAIVTEELAGTQGAFIPGGQGARPLASRPAIGPLWYVKDGKVGVLQVRSGLSDGTNTEIMGPGIEEGMEIIIGLNPIGAAGNATTNPFQQGGRGGAFGGPGGGFGGAGGRR